MPREPATFAVILGSAGRRSPGAERLARPAFDANPLVRPPTSRDTDTMKAVLCKSFGPPDTLVIEDVASPTAGAGEVVVTVRAAALNFFDTLIIENKYQFKPSLPFSPGAELAGTVKALGDGVVGFAVGDRVMAYAGWGACREEVAVEADRVVALPAGLDFASAAGLSVTYGTTIHALKDRARLQPGETLCVLGAAGGVGQSAVELGKIMGARVIAAASSDDKLAFCRRIGADETINYSTDSLKDRLKELTGGAGADVIYDPVGGTLSEEALRATAWEGRFLVVGFAAGHIPRIPLNLVLLKGCQICGVFWGDFVRRSPQANAANVAQLVAWCADGRIKPHIHGRYPLERTAEALGALARREVMGKVIIEL
jgi:NADPH2:quinone reductase